MLFVDRIDANVPENEFLDEDPMITPTAMPLYVAATRASTADQRPVWPPAAVRMPIRYPSTRKRATAKTYKRSP